MKLGVALVAWIAVLGCDRGDDKQCRTDVDELTRWLGTLNIEPHLIIDRVRLVSRTDLGSHPPPGVKPIVTIGAQESTFQGQLIGAADELESRLSATQRRIVDEIARGRFEGAPPEPRQLYLVIDEAAPWERVVAVVQAAHRAGFTMPSFLFAPPPGPDTRPPRTAFDDRMDARERDLAAGKTSPGPGPTESLLERCPSVIRLFGELGMMQTGNKAEAMVRGLGPALVECRCKVDLPSLRSMLWRMLNNASPVRELGVELGPDAPPIALPASTPWREASKRLTPATKRTWLAIGT